MYEQISPNQLAGAVSKVIGSAVGRIDFMSNTHIGLVGDHPAPTLAEIIRSIPSHVSLRCYLGLPEESEYRRAVGRKLRDIASIDRKDSKICVGHVWTGPHVIMADGAVAFVASMPITGLFRGEWNIFVTDDSKIVTEYADLFEEIWKYSPYYHYLVRSPQAAAIRTWDNLITVSTIDWDAVIRLMAATPEALHSMTPRTFEEFVAGLLAKQGLDVRLTQLSKDGGRDILATSRGFGGDLLYLIECKRYRPDRPVGISIVRSLYGVVERERATAGLLFTTSRFTKNAVAFQTQLRHRLTLHDYQSIVEWVLNLDRK